jgi:hypothetical protein
MTWPEKSPPGAAWLGCYACWSAFGRLSPWTPLHHALSSPSSGLFRTSRRPVKPGQRSTPRGDELRIVFPVDGSPGPRFCRCPAGEILVRPEVVVPATEGVEVAVPETRARQLLVELAQAALEGAEEPFNAAVLPGCEGSGALVTDAQKREYKTKQLRGEESLVVGPQNAGLPEAFDGIKQEAENGDRGFALEMPQSHAETGAMVDDTQECRRLLAVIRRNVRSRPQTTLRGSGLGLRDRISRRCSRISRWLSRTTLATKLLPTVMPLRSSQRWLKVSAMERQPA